MVDKQGLTLSFTIGARELGPSNQPIWLSVEDYLIDGNLQWGREDNRCYFPIFVADSGTNVDVM